MKQYFSDNSDLPHRYFDIDFTYMGHRLRFLGDAGVFSKREVDDATALLLQKIPAPVGKLLDLGCGYGLVGISLKKAFSSCEVTCCDINPRAVELTKENALKNEVELYTLLSDGIPKGSVPFDNIYLNPPIRAGKETIFRLYEESERSLSPGGKLYIVIQKKHGAESHFKKLKSIFYQSEIIYKKSGFYIIESQKGEPHEKN